MTTTAPFPALTAHREHYGATVSTNRRSRARNVRFYVLISSVVFMLILSDVGTPKQLRVATTSRHPSLSD